MPASTESPFLNQFTCPTVHFTVHFCKPLWLHGIRSVPWPESTSSSRSRSRAAGCYARSPRSLLGSHDWGALPEGTYFIEWRDNGQRKREPAGITASQALEAQRKKRHALEGRRWSIITPSPAQQGVDAGDSPLQALIERYLEQIETLKKPNTFRKYECVLQRFGEHFRDEHSPTSPSIN